MTDIIERLKKASELTYPDRAAYIIAIAEIVTLRDQVASLELKLKLAVRSPAEDLIEAELLREQKS